LKPPPSLALAKHMEKEWKPQFAFQKDRAFKNATSSKSAVNA